MRIVKIKDKYYLKDSLELNKLANAFYKAGNEYNFDRDKYTFNELLSIAKTVKTALQKEISRIKTEGVSEETSREFKDIDSAIHQGYTDLYDASTERRNSAGKKLAQELQDLSMDYFRLAKNKETK